MSITLGSVTLENVETIDVEKNANIIPIPTPTQDSDQTIVFDMLGVTKIIGVRGFFTGVDIATVKAKSDQLEALANGFQGTVVFYSPCTGNVNVMIMEVRLAWDVPGFRCGFDVKILQGINA